MMEFLLVYFMPSIITFMVVFFGHCIWAHKKAIKNGWRKEDEVWDDDEE